MNTLRRSNTIGLMAVLSLSVSVSAQPAAQTVPAAQPGTAAPTQKASATTDAAVTEAESSLRRVTVGYQAGANTSADVSRATITLAEARIRSAIAQKQPAVVPQNLETILQQRQALLKSAETQYQAGALKMSDLNKARAASAEAHVLSDLWTLVTIRDQELSQTRQLFQSGAISTDKVDKAAAVLHEAQSRFAESQKSSEE